MSLGGGRGCYAGVPLTFRCAKCKVGRPYWDYGDESGQDYEVTGRVKPLTAQQEGRCRPRTVLYRIEYKCRTCGHMGWTRHYQPALMLRGWRRKRGLPENVEVPKRRRRERGGRTP